MNEEDIDLILLALATSPVDVPDELIDLVSIILKEKGEKQND